MQIGKISLHLEKQAEKQSLQKDISQKLATNPFGVSFKGNVIQADVFQSSAKKTHTSIQEKGKLFASAVVSGINNFNDAFKSRMNAMVSFGKKVTSSIFDSIEKFGNTEIKLDIETIKNKLFPDRQYSVKNLSNRPVEELKSLWSDLTVEAV